MFAGLGITTQFVLVTTVSLFTIVNPLGATPLFLSHTANYARDERLSMARRASLTCAVVLFVFAIAGEKIFHLLGVSFPALRIAGAFLVFTNAFEMLRGANVRTRTLPEEQKDAAEKQDISIIPLGVPLLAGPGAITTVIILMIHATNFAQMAVVFCAIALVAESVYWILRSSSVLLRALGPSGVRIMNRLMGLILAAISVQFVINGIKDLLPEFAKLI